MKCHEIHNWLLSTRETKALPREAREHLDRCPRCLRRLRRLDRLDEQVRALPLPPSDRRIRAELWTRIDCRTKPTDPPKAPAPRRWSVLSFLGKYRRFTGKMVTAAGLATLVFALGFLVGQYRLPSLWEGSAPTSTVPPGDGSSIRSETATLVRIVQHDIRLANTTAAEEQIAVLGLLANDLRQEAFDLVAHGTPEEVPALSRLYQQVLQQGLLPRLALLPPDRKASVVDPLLADLRASANEVDAVARDLLPVVAELVQPFATVARESVRLVETGQLSNQNSPSPIPLPPSRALLGDLVMLALNLVNEKDPLRRANLCSQVAIPLASALVLVSARGATGESNRLGEALGDLLQWGVADNLARANQADSSDQRQAEFQLVQQRSGQALAFLERNLAQASPEVQNDLRQAMESSRTGMERVQESGRKTGNAPGSTGPPWMRSGNDPGKGKPVIPPGLLRKGPPGGRPKG